VLPPARVTTSAAARLRQFIVPHHVKRVLADIDTDHGDPRIELVWHGVLLVFGAPCQLPLLAGPEHGRTIPLPDMSARFCCDARLRPAILGIVLGLGSSRCSGASSFLLGGDAASPFALAARKDGPGEHARDRSCFRQSCDGHVAGIGLRRRCQQCLVRVL
jgi:hypothetical protein